MVISMKDFHFVLPPLMCIRTLRNSIDTMKVPLKPGDILFPPDKQPHIVTGSSPPVRQPSVLGRKCDDTAVQDSSSRCVSMADFLPLELPLGDSDDYLCPPASDTTMDKLDGVFMYVNCCPLVASCLINSLTLSLY